VALLKDRPVGFLAMMHGVGKTRFFRISRIVTIPDYQGIGIAKALMGFIGEHYAMQGKLPLMMVTSNPQFLHTKIPNWAITRIGHNSRHTMRQLKGAGSRDRITISMRYKPPRKSDQNLITLPPHPE